MFQKHMQRFFTPMPVLLAATLLLASLSTVPKAQATLLGVHASYPDLVASYGISMDTSVPGVTTWATLPNTMFDLFTADNQDVWITGAYSLSSDLSHSGSLSITGTFDSNNIPFYLTGDIFQVGVGTDGKAYDFLIHLTSVDDLMSNYGFGAPGSTIGATLALNGGQWQADTMPVPEPGTMVLLSAGLFGVIVLRRRS